MKSFKHRLVILFALVIASTSFALAQRASTIKLDLDASEAARNVLHVKETISVRPGPFTLFYPKWIPGEHRPSGVLNDMANLFITANGKPIEWTRDDVEMYAFHLKVPAGVSQIDVTFDNLSQPFTTSSAWIARIKWNRLVLYPRGVPSDRLQVSASMKVPSDWKYATALPVAGYSNDYVAFRPVSLTTLVDSPAMIGKYFKKVQLTDGPILHEMDIAADTDEALTFKLETLTGWKNLVKEARILYGARHYSNYYFLVSLSDNGGSEGLEHHESSENGVGLNSLSDPDLLNELSDLLGHEFTHSWNGKYRRPADLTTPDFDKPMYGDLLWVYEGLTQYLGYVLPTRSGLWTPEVFRETIASNSARMDNRSGRRWRSLVDTARAVQFSYPSPFLWGDARRQDDYYFEGMMIWMEADVLIRQKSGGKHSLDDFIREFYGGKDSGPMVRTYTLADITVALNKVVPYDWNGFFRQRVYTVQKNGPLGGITNGGYSLAYSETPNLRIGGGDRLQGSRNLMFSLGIYVASNGYIYDVNPDMPAAKAGIAPGTTIVRADGKEYTHDDLMKAVADSKTNAGPITIITDNGGVKQTYTINYHGGHRYPHLVRDMTKADILSEVIKGH